MVEFTDGDLIDTLWNVKLFVFHFRPRVCGDLIDTLWNVKRSKVCKIVARSQL